MAFPNVLQQMGLKNPSCIPPRAWELEAELPQDGSAWFGCFVSSLLFVVFMILRDAKAQRDSWLSSKECSCHRFETLAL